MPTKDEIQAALDVFNKAETEKSEFRGERIGDLFWFTEEESNKIRTVLQSALAEKRDAQVGWQPIATAPMHGELIAVVTNGGYVLKASYQPLDSDGFAWHSADDSDFPPSWNDGICWESNEEGMRSDQPEYWIPLPTPTAAVKAAIEGVKG